LPHQRNLIERMFCRLKGFDKPATYAAALAAAILWWT
jgi:hypothetical protein